MKKGRAIGLFMNITFGILFCLIMSVVVMYRVGAPITPETVFMSLVSSFFVSYTIGDLVPSTVWGNKLAAKIGLGKVGSYFFSLIVHDFFMCTLCSFIVTFSMNGFTMTTITAWWYNYPILLVFAYILMVVMFKPLLSFALYISRNLED